MGTFFAAVSSQLTAMHCLQFIFVHKFRPPSNFVDGHASYTVRGQPLTLLTDSYDNICAGMRTTMHAPWSVWK